MATLKVGPGSQFATIASAVNAAAAGGDVLQVQAGTYTNDFLDFAKNITLQAVNGPGPGIISVQICNLRRKLGALGIRIDRVRGVGLFIRPESKERLRALALAVTREAG